MSSENTLTGRQGNVTVGGAAVARLTAWEVNPTMATSSEWGDSDGNAVVTTAGFTNRAAGRKDAAFTTEGKYDTTDEIFDLFESGDIAAVVLNMDVATTFWNFARALCSDFNLAVNVDTEEVIGWTAAWGADGHFQRPGVAAPA